MFQRLREQSGNTLITVLIGAAILGTVMTALMSTMNSSVRGARHLSLSEDVSSIRNLVTQSLDCSATLAGVNVATSECDLASSSRRFLVLKDKNGHALTGPLDTTVGAFQNTAPSGNWNILTECDRANFSIVVRAARKGAGGFAQDPLTKRTYDFTAQNSYYLFGGPMAPKLCTAQMGGASSVGTCPPGMSVQSVNFDTRTVTCAPSSIPAVSCPKNYAVTGFNPDGSPVCRYFISGLGIIGYGVHTSTNYCPPGFKWIDPGSGWDGTRSDTGTVDCSPPGCGGNVMFCMPER